MTTTTESQAPESRSSGKDQKRLGRLIVGVISLVLSVGYFITALGMPRGTFDSPGPGMFPLGVGIGAIVISLIVIFEGLRNIGTSGSLSLPVGEERSRVLIFLGTLIVFITIIPFIGQYIASVLYVGVTLKLLGKLSWVKAILGGVVIGLGMTALFAEGLGMQLPMGIW